jgi:putative flippase GtrA
MPAQSKAVAAARSRHGSDGHWRRLWHDLDVRRFVLFGLVSTGGAAIDFVVALSLIRLGVSPALALAGAMSVSAVLVYVVHQRRTFADLGGRDLSWRRLLMFCASTVLVYLFRLALYGALVAAGAAAALALAVALVASVLVNFTISRALIFMGRG